MTCFSSRIFGLRLRPSLANLAIKRLAAQLELSLFRDLKPRELSRFEVVELRPLGWELP